MELEILFKDDDFVAINKPHGLLVHRSKYADEANVFAVQELRNQIGQYVWPCHRLDRKTSGVLLFALNEQANSLMQQQFANNQTIKTYRCIVRGFTDDKGIIDYALINDKDKKQDAITAYKTIKQSEIEVPFGKFNTSRYSLVEVYPKSGRLHQIRKHFAHIFHPIIADRPHGCNKQNGLFKERWKMDTMMLYAKQLQFNHPILKTEITINAQQSSEFNRVLHLLSMV